MTPARARRWGLLALAALAALVLVGPARAQEAAPAATEPAVRLVQPAAGAYLAGATVLEAEPVVPTGAVLERVEFEVNGEIVGTRREPPWRVTHDFGQEVKAWFIRARLVLGDGRSATDTVRTRALQVHATAGIELVNVFATVQDGRGRYAMNLTREDFLLLEDGRPQEILYFSRDRLPLAVAIVLDTSLSMAERNLPEAKAAALKFLDALAPEDQVGILAFNDDVRELLPLTADREQARDALKGAVARGGTALYDAVSAAARRLALVEDERRRAIILLSDGRDEAASGLTPGSVLTFEEALADTIQADVILYAIGLGRDLDQKLDFYGRHSLEEVLTSLAAETGGRAYFTRRAERLDSAYGDIETELRHHYTLSYTSSNRRRDGSWRRIDLQVREPGHTVRARRGYYAPDDGPLP